MWKNSSKSNLRTLPSVKMMKKSNDANYRINITNVELTFSCIKFLLMLVEFKWEKVINSTTFVSTASIESCFGMPIFYIDFCFYQLNQYGSYWPSEAWLLKVKSEFLLNLDIAMMKKVVSYQPLLRKWINLGIQTERRRVGHFPYRFWK